VERTVRAACIAVALFCAPNVLPAFADGVPAARMALLARGIAISEWFAPWSEQRLLGTWHTADDAALLRRLGFTFVRLPASPQ